MKSLQAKFIVLILAGIILSSVTIGGLGVYYSRNVTEQDAQEIMNLYCEKETGEIDELLKNIETGTTTLARFAENQMGSLEELQDPAFRDEYVTEVEKLALTIAKNTEGALAVYVRLSPEWTGDEGSKGFFRVQMSEGGAFMDVELTDLGEYEEGDAGHVGWYYEPLRAGRPIWLDPYLNENLGVEMMSYVIPIYDQGRAAGVAGMDIRLSKITDRVADIKVYDSGNAALVNADGDVIYHKGTEGRSFSPELSEADQMQEIIVNNKEITELYHYTYQGIKKGMVFKSLSNDMRLLIMAPEKEIHAVAIRFSSQTLIAIIMSAFIFMGLTTIVCRRLIKPLEELTEASKRIAQEDLSVSLTYHGKDEIGVLFDSFRETVRHLETYINYINGLAYRDAMTGVKNKRSYETMVKRLDNQIKVDKAEFAVISLDANELKRTNDTYGHIAGDELIKADCRVICRSFPGSPVFRIGGDEFAVVLETADYDNRMQLLEDLAKNVEQANRENTDESIVISIAYGMAVYERGKDQSYEEVFARADQAMYDCKHEMKAGR